MKSWCHDNTCKARISVNFAHSTTGARRAPPQQTPAALPGSRHTASCRLDPIPSQLHRQLLPHRNFTLSPPSFPDYSIYRHFSQNLLSPTLPLPACSLRPASRPIHPPRTSPPPTPQAFLRLPPPPTAPARLPPGQPQPGSAAPAPSPGLPPAAPGRRPSSSLTAGSARSRHTVFPGAAVPSRKGSGCSHGPARSVPRAAESSAPGPSQAPASSGALARRSGRSGDGQGPAGRAGAAAAEQRRGASAGGWGGGRRCRTAPRASRRPRGCARGRRHHPQPPSASGPRRDRLETGDSQGTARVLRVKPVRNLLKN